MLVGFYLQVKRVGCFKRATEATGSVVYIFRFADRVDLFRGVVNLLTRKVVIATFTNNL